MMRTDELLSILLETKWVEEILIRHDLLVTFPLVQEERSCLIIAAIRGQVRVAKFLLERGVDIHYQAPS